MEQIHINILHSRMLDKTRILALIKQFIYFLISSACCTFLLALSLPLISLYFYTPLPISLFSLLLSLSAVTLMASALGLVTRRSLQGRQWENECEVELGSGISSEEGVSYSGLESARYSIMCETLNSLAIFGCIMALDGVFSSQILSNSPTAVLSHLFILSLYLKIVAHYSLLPSYIWYWRIMDLLVVPFQVAVYFSLLRACWSRF